METPPTNWYKHRASDIDLGMISDDRLGPPEVGGVPTPTIPYRAGVMAAGGALINPRLESTLGWLLHGAMGSWSATADVDVFGTADTAMNNHKFVFSTTNQAYVPFMGFRKEIPGTALDGSDDMGETFSDCKIIALTLALPNDGLITSRVDVLGRAADTVYTDNPSFTYVNTLFEDFESIPIGSVVGGFFKIPGFSATELPITNATVTLANAPLDIRMEKVYGSPYLEDVTIIGRSLTADILVKWRDPQLYRRILTGSTVGTNWSAFPFVEDLDVYALSPGLASAASPWQLRVRAAEIMWQVVGGIRLAGNQAVMMRITGTAIAPSSGDYATINLGNLINTTGYTWPT
jgi:hypothetical protein